MPRAEWRRSWLYSSIQAATLARASALVAKRSRRRSSNSTVECQDSITALSSADPGATHRLADAQPVAGGPYQPGGVLAALVGVQDDPGDRVPPAAHRDRHGQRRVGQPGVVMLAQGEA